jgi:3-polyprenyl-4-hydroxybenzoate decarboxylase
MRLVIGMTGATGAVIGIRTYGHQEHGCSISSGWTPT